MSRGAWLDAHAFLAPVARFCGEVETALAGIPAPAAPREWWDEHGPDFDAGVPLLHSSSAPVELEPGGALAVALVERLAAGSPDGALAEDARALRAELAREPDAAQRVARWLLGDESLAPSAPGLLRYLGWTALARYLAPVVAAFGGLRGAEGWLRAHCPVCGALPAMAQLIGVDPGRKRFLCCGRCLARWRYTRMGCPFCERDDQRLGVVAVEGEAGLRIDYCESCRGYLKTYNGAGQEAVCLADWTSLHLDVLAYDRGLKRLAVSLYDLEPAVHP